MVAGGGNALITDLLDVPGASRTVIEIIVPYAEAAMADFVGVAAGELGGIVSAEHAERLAVAAHRRARSLAGGDGDVHGLAVTAALATDRPKRGDHRAHLALAGDAGTASRRVDLDKGRLDRAAEDRVVADAALALLADRFTLI